MTRLFDWLVEAWDRIRGLLGINRLTRKGRGDALEGRGALRRILYFLRPFVALFVLAYVGTMVWRFTWVRGEDLVYPQPLLAAIPATAEGGCAPSRIVHVQQALIDLLVNENDWAPATPQYKIGLFGLVSWDATPFFDNKAAFQKGALATLRRMSLELGDTLGRVRGTSGADADLEAARALLATDERAWIFNPFDARLPLLATSASSAYRNAQGLFSAYNARVAACEALFDARSDNLFALLDSFSTDLGSAVDEVASRSQTRVYDVASHSFVEGGGNNLGWFDFRADNLFHEARGRMYAMHGLMQAARVDFAEVIAQRNLSSVWDRMEAHIAEAAALDPLIVSNGSEDGMFAPAHLSAMAQYLLRARANMTELRDVLAR